MFSELILTDGTTKIDLLGGNKNGAGFSLVRYVPGRPGLKAGGVWQDSPLATGRQLVSGIKTNVVDALSFYIAYPSNDEIVYALESLDLLLEKALAYWTTSWQQAPVYLQAIAHGETSKRYAVIHMAQYDQYFDPYAQPYISAGMHTTEEFTVGIERGPWLGNVPGTYTNVSIAHQDIATPITGYEAITQDGVMIGNMHNDGLQAVYRFTGSFSSNLLNSSLPYAIFANPVAAGNILYLGADQPFFGLVFNLTVQYTDTLTVVWEFWNGSAWTAITPTSDATVGLFLTGIRRVLFAASDLTTWAKTTINSEERYWLRARVSAVGTTDSPQQGTRQIYATTNGYINVAASEIDGTLDALMRLTISRYASENGTGGWRGYFGLRSYDRGDEFTAFLGELTAGSLATLNSADPTSASGQSVAATNFSSFTDIAYARMDTTIYPVDPFYGRFRMFVRMNSDDNTGASQVRYRLTNPTNTDTVTFAYGEAKAVPTTPTTYQLIDLGYVTLPPGGENVLLTDPTIGFWLRVQGIVPSGKTLTVYEIILLPVDEWTAEVDSGDIANTTGGIQSAFIDPISYPKQQRRAFVYGGEVSPNISIPLTVIMNGPPILHANSRQRLWFVFLVEDKATPDIAATIRINKSQRYLSLRGD